jgi:hypothetical protein
MNMLQEGIYRCGTSTKDVIPLQEFSWFSPPWWNQVETLQLLVQCNASMGTPPAGSLKDYKDSFDL